MEHTLKKAITLLLLSSLLTASLAACGSGSGETTETTAAATDTAAQTETETEPELAPELPDFDCGGADLTVLTKMEGTEAGRWTAMDIYVEELTGEPMNDAVYDRNILVQEKYNCVIRQERMAMADMPSGIAKFITAGDSLYDIIMPNCTSAATLSLDGMLYELNTIGNVNLAMPWWNAQFTADTTIGGKNYFANGDISETFMRATYAVFFNKQSIIDYSLENPYDLVEEGSWTMEKIQEMGAVFASDLNGDGKRDDSDNVGLIVLNNQVECLYTASGEKLVQAEDGGFVFAGDSERSIGVLEKIYGLYTNKDVVLCASDNNRRSEETKSMGHVEVGEKTFAEGRCLFLMGTMNNVVAMREMDTDFGILPIPKADEAQSEYYSYANTWAASCAAIPVTAADTEKSSILMEELAYQARQFYTPAYYDVTLKTKVSRDEESSAMLDLIYERRTADLGNLFAVGGVMSGVTDLIFPQGKNTFASFMASKEKSINTRLDEMKALCQ